MGTIKFWEETAVRYTVDKILLYEIAWWSLFSFFFYCGNGDAFGTSVSVHYIIIVDVRSSGVVFKWGSTLDAFTIEV